jgi:hypothetical protein
MKAFTIDAENNIVAHASAKAAPKTEGTELFTSQDALEELAAAWPARLVDIFNSLTGVTPVKKFADRKKAVARIWTELQKLGEARHKAPTPHRRGSREEEGQPGEETDPRAGRDARRGRTARIQQDGPAYRDAHAGRRGNARTDLQEVRLAATHDAGHDERRGCTDQKVRVGCNQREGWRRTPLFSQRLRQPRPPASPGRRIHPRRLLFIGILARIAKGRVERHCLPT